MVVCGHRDGQTWRSGLTILPSERLQYFEGGRDVETRCNALVGQFEFPLVRFPHNAVNALSCERPTIEDGCMKAQDDFLKPDHLGEHEPGFDGRVERSRESITA